MKILKHKEKIDRFWQEVEGGEGARLIMLDYDGTLAPFVTNPHEAYPYPGIPELIKQIIQDKRNRVVIVSGRNAQEVKRLLGLDMPIEIWGGHGSEHLLPNGQLVQDKVSTRSEQIFNKVVQWAHRHGLDDRLEEKHGCVAFHVRGMDRAKAKELLGDARQFFDKVSSNSALEVDSFDGGVELRTAGTNKGQVVKSLLAEFGDAGPKAYFGDDLTDEDAFVALDGAGVSFLVREEYRPTQADIWIIPPEELKYCLGRFTIKK